MSKRTKPNEPTSPTGRGSAPAPTPAPALSAPVSAPSGSSPAVPGALGFLGGLLSGALVLWLGMPAPQRILVPQPAPAPAPLAAPTPAPAPSAPLLAQGLSVNARGLQRPNVHTDFNPDLESPRVDSTAFLDPYSSVIGHVEIGAHVYLGPFSSIRGDEGQPLHIGPESNLQDGVVIHALETVEHGKPKPENEYVVNGKSYAVYIGERVSLAHQSQVHGPAWVEDDVFVGMQALIFRAHIGKGAVIEPGAIIIGVTIPPNRYVSAGKAITDQATADALPMITDSYPFHAIDKAVVHVNHNLAEAYSGRKAEE
jgi:carbonic anhydrase